MAALPKKKCPKPGVMVKTKAGLVGATTGNCGKRRSVEVALLGVGAAEFRRSELKALTKNQTARLKTELKRVPKLGPKTPPAAIHRFTKPTPAVIPSTSHEYDPYEGMSTGSRRNDIRDRWFVNGL